MFRRQAARRGGDVDEVTLSTDLPLPAAGRGEELVLRVHDALTAFAEVEDAAVDDSIPVFSGRERWQVWRRR